MEADHSICEICGEYRSDLNHNNSVNHRFHFMKWCYSNCRKALINDRHGVTLNVEPVRINNFHFDFAYIKGKYVMKVTPEQLRLHKNTITFKCKIKNTKQESIYLTNTNLLHPSEDFDITLSKNFGEDANTYIKLDPDKYFPFEVTFKTNLLQCASYKMPLSCDLQTIDNKYCFTILRAFLIIIDKNTGTTEKIGKSPFTSKSWKDVTRLIPSTKETPYTDKCEIPREYKPILDHGLERFDGMTSENETNRRNLRGCVETLTKENYGKFWHTLLWMEERAATLMLMKYNMENVTMEVRPDKTLVLEVPGLAEKRPSVIVGDFIKIRLTADHTAYKGFVCKVNNKTVEISHVDDELLEYLQENPNSHMDVAFMLSRLALERMHHAVDAIVHTGMVEKLFPSQRIYVENKKSNTITRFYDQSVRNNADQSNAVNKIVNSVQDLPYIVFGPPGTGKTVTIVEAILQLKNRGKKILVCAPANSACDMLAIKLMERCNKEELIRIHSTTRERTTITEELKEYSNMDDDEFTIITPDQLNSYKIVVTTLTKIGSFSGVYHPDCVFIDEAAQACEPEADIAIALISSGKHVVLAGDPKQLGPMATDCAAKYGLGKSLLERLMDYPVYKLNPKTKTYNTDFITMLTSNFRSHPLILQIPNEMFYDNLLKAQSQEAQQDPIGNIAIFPLTEAKGRREGRPVEFCSISAKEKKEGSSPSFFNPFEVKKVVKYVQALLSLNLGEALTVREDQIGVVTPYKRQVHKIKEGLEQVGYEDVEVGTTESFQGREKRIIIISTVRAQHSLLLHDRKYRLGFVKEDKRFNVAITRAISKLIVIGCPLVLRTDHKWATYMDLCRQFGTYFGNYFAPDDSVFREDVVYRMRKFKQADDQYNKSSTK